MISVLFLGGIQLLSIGIIGEYISRIQTDVRKRPLYIVRDTNVMPE
jgi:dolichol-phosphate mannosyltransferase